MYKIILDNKIIDVVNKPRFLKFLPYGHIAMTDKTSAVGILGSDNQTIYSFLPSTDYPVVSVVEVNIEEFNRLQGLLNSGREIYVDDNVLVKAKQAKLKSLSIACKNNISAGFSVKLSDNCVHEFKLTTEDQINLLSLENLYNAGEESFIYHATGELCQVFTREDLSKILKAYRHHVLYHTTYFNAAKHYVSSLTNPDEVNKFTYGTDVGQEHDSVTLRNILRNGESL